MNRAICVFVYCIPMIISFSSTSCSIFSKTTMIALLWCMSQLHAWAGGTEQWISGKRGTITCARSYTGIKCLGQTFRCYLRESTLDSPVVLESLAVDLQQSRSQVRHKRCDVRLRPDKTIMLKPWILPILSQGLFDHCEYAHRHHWKQPGWKWPCHTSQKAVATAATEEAFFASRHIEYFLGSRSCATPTNVACWGGGDPQVGQANPSCAEWSLSKCRTWATSPIHEWYKA